MSYTLNKLQAARRNLVGGHYTKALKHIEDLIERMEKILHMRKNWKPKCKLTQELNYGTDSRTESEPQEPSGKLGHTGDNGLFPVGQRLRHLATENRPSGTEGKDSGLHSGGEPA
jgi:hypothetical protein